MEPRVKASLLWGAIGALVFLVGIQAFRLVTGDGASIGAAFGVALVVGVAAAAATYVLEGRAVAKEQS